MRVHLLIDSNIKPNIGENDVVLVSRYNHVRIEVGKVVLIDPGKSNESNRVGDEMMELYSRFGNEYKKSLNSSYVRLFLPLESVLDTLDEVLSNDSYSEIVLYEGSKVPFFKSENAEAEGVRKHYKTNWMVNAFVYSKYASTYSIIWIAQQSQLFTRIKAIYFNAINCIRVIAPRVIKRLLSSNEKESLNLTTPSVISFISLLLQKRHLDSLLSGNLNGRHIYFSFDTSIVDWKTVYPVIELPLAKLFSIVFKYLFKERLPLQLKYKGFCQHTLARELQYLQLKYSIYEERMIQTLSSVDDIEKNLMVSNTTFGDDMMGIHSVAQYYRMHHINIQYVSMDRILYPNLKMADEYYIYAQRTFDFYKRIESSFKLYLPQKNSIIQKSKDERVFVIFMQPDSFCEDYFDYFKTLFPEFSKLGFDYKIIVKPHYRQNRLDDLCNLCEEYPFVRVASPNENVESLINQASVIMSICSSVIFEAMMNHVPSIIYNPRDKYHSFVYNNDYCFPEVNIVTSDPIESLSVLENYDEYYKEFSKKLELFILGYGASIDIKGEIEEYLSL